MRHILAKKKRKYPVKQNLESAMLDIHSIEFKQVEKELYALAKAQIHPLTHYFPFFGKPFLMDVYSKGLFHQYSDADGVWDSLWTVQRRLIASGEIAEYVEYKKELKNILGATDE